MGKRKKLAATSDEVDQAFGILDKALRRTGRILAEAQDDIRSSESEVDLEDIDLPESLRDPLETLERGRHLLNCGFSVERIDTQASKATRNHLAQAARNGESISREVQERMHRDRSAAKIKKKEA